MAMSLSVPVMPLSNLSISQVLMEEAGWSWLLVSGMASRIDVHQRLFHAHAVDLQGCA